MSAIHDGVIVHSCGMLPCFCFDGTRWTEEGQGATWKELHRAYWDSPLWPHGRSIKERDTMMYAERRTNLALTGQPLTAEDVKRIARAR